MSHLSLVTRGSPQISPPDMLKDHKRVIQNYFDALRARGLSPGRIAKTRCFIEHWFEKIRVTDARGGRQLYIWEAMKPFEGRKRIKEFLMTLSAVDDNNQVCLRATTVRAYAGHLSACSSALLTPRLLKGWKQSHLNTAQSKTHSRASNTLFTVAINCVPNNSF